MKKFPKAVALILIFLAYPPTAEGDGQASGSSSAGLSWDSEVVENSTKRHEANRDEFGQQGSVAPEAANGGFSDRGRSQGSHLDTQSHGEVPSGRRFGPSSQAPRDAGGDVHEAKVVCSNGLRLAFDCALKRLIAFGVRDHLVEKYKLPMVALDVCQGDTLVDAEQCIPDDFVNIFPYDRLLEVVRQKRLTVGTIDLSAFPQLASDQGNTTGFYPELVQAIVRELTVIVLQNRGLRKELIGDRPLNISILGQSLSERIRDVKAATARRCAYGEACESKSSMGVHGLQPFPHSSGGRSSSPDELLLGRSGQPTLWQDGLIGVDAPSGASICQSHVSLFPWESIPKDIFIGVKHVKFSTPMNLIAAVHRGEVDMTDVGTLASAYLPERYNFLPLREVLEPSCTIGAWKSFFLLRDSASKRRRELRSSFADRQRSAFMQYATSDEETSVRPSGFPHGPQGGVEFGDSPAGNHPKNLATEEASRDGRRDLRYLVSPEPAESWESRLRRTRMLFFKLYGVQTESASVSNGSQSEASPNLQAGGSSRKSQSRSSDAEAVYEEKTLVKLHHVDHFTFSYLFLEDFRICSVRKLTDLSSLMSDGEPIGAFGYGLAGRGGRRRIAPGWHCPPQQMRVQRVLGSALRKDGIGFGMDRKSRHVVGSTDSQSILRRSLQEEGLPQVMDFHGPLVPLAAFFAKSRDPVCRGYRRRAIAHVKQMPAARSSAAEFKTPSFAPVLVALVTTHFIMFA